MPEVWKEKKRMEEGREIDGGKKGGSLGIILGRGLISKEDTVVEGDVWSKRGRSY